MDKKVGRLVSTEELETRVAAGAVAADGWDTAFYRVSQENELLSAKQPNETAKLSARSRSNNRKKFWQAVRDFAAPYVRSEQHTDREIAQIVQDRFRWVADDDAKGEGKARSGDDYKISTIMKRGLQGLRKELKKAPPIS